MVIGFCRGQGKPGLKKNMDERTTMFDIAQIAGVSIGSVDRALNNRGRISAETRSKILQAVEECGYRPNKIASTLGKRRTIRIAAIFPSKPDYFFDEIARGFEMAQQEFDDYKLEITHITTLNLDAKTQRNKLKVIKKGDYDAVLLATGGKDLKGIIDKMLESGIPIATFNSDAVQSKRLFYIGINYINSGRIAANILGPLCHGKGKVAVFSGFADVSCHQDRKTGFLEVMRNNYPRMEYVFGDDYGDRDDLAYTIISKYLKTHEDITAIFTNSAPGIVGAGRAVEELEPKRRPILIGYDLNQYTAAMLKNGLCWAIIDQSPSRQSYYAAKTMLNYLINGSLGEIVSIKSHIILKESLHDYQEYN
jgi:LacI family transcriptional regulator